MISILYRGNVENKGMTEWVKDGRRCGTVGESLRLEGIYAKLETDEDLGLELQGHVQDIGWMQPVGQGELCGTIDQSKRLEAIKIKLTGSAADKYSIVYGVHVEKIGDMQTAQDGEPTGTEGMSDRIEAIQIWIVEKGIDFKVESLESFVKVEPTPEQTIPVSETTETDMASDHFAWAEFECDCPKPQYNFGWCNGYPETDYPDHSMSPDLIQMIEQLRVNIDVPITVNSGVRCEQCNSYWGGVPDSLHKLGEAADLYCPSLSVDELADAALNVGLGVIRYYSSQFVHVQVWPRDTVGD